ncbi:MAG: ABC transporter ATP-binding protein [Candidatus Izemoplasmataceae bacterium]
MAKAVKVSNLTKTYDDILAVDDISFEVEKNSFFAFLGPNGAGKSTTINIISTLLDHDAGDVEIFGLKLGKDDAAIRRKIGVVFQQSMLDKLLTVKENLLVRASFYGIDSSGFEARIKEINEFIEIEEFMNQPYGDLSGGQKRKADIARALLHWPDLLMLDEPTTGLDPKSRKDIWTLINKLREEKEITIFLTTHYMEEVKDASRVVVIDRGNIVAVGSSEELRTKYSNDRLKVIPKASLEETLVKDGVSFYKVNDTLNIILDTCFDGLEIVEKYRDHMREFEILRGDMDDVFLNITGRKLGEE